MQNQETLRSGGRTNPTITLYRIAVALEVSLTDLVNIELS